MLGLFLMLSVLVLAANDPSTGIYGEDVEEIQGAVDNYTPINEDGEFDPSKFNNTISKAEERINEINGWLEENASWLNLVFGMTPEISWIFALNLYFWLLFLLIFAINADVFKFFIPKNAHAHLAGLCVFVGLLVLKFYLILARGVFNLADLIWNTILPVGMVVAIIALIIIIIVLVVIGIYAPEVLVKIAEAVAKWRLKRAEGKAALDREILHTEVEAIQGR